MSDEKRETLKKILLAAMSVSALAGRAHLASASAQSSHNAIVSSGGAGNAMANPVAAGFFQITTVAPFIESAPFSQWFAEEFIEFECW
jgi:hypothetical protein